MTAGLHAGSDDSESAGVLERQQIHGDCRRGGRARFGDVTPVHDGQQRAGAGIHQQDSRQVRRQALLGIVVANGDQLRSQGRFAGSDAGRHRGEEAPGNCKDRTNGLRYLVGGESRDRTLDGIDQVAHRQQGADVRFVEPEGH